jgi:hypothetical protein
MRHWKQILIICILVISGCSSKGDRTDNKKLIERYFDYDNIDYYFNDFNEDSIEELYSRQSRSDLDSLRAGIILGTIPNDTTDLTFIDKLGTIGYTKEQINESKFKSIDEIFREKPVDEILTHMCIRVYRDILVFKKRDKVVGVAKVCFDCWDQEIVGTASNTNGFGQNGDYERLFKLVRD